MVSGDCPNCNESDVVTSDIFECPYCNGIMHGSLHGQGCSSDLIYYYVRAKVVRTDEYGREETKTWQRHREQYRKCSHCHKWFNHPMTGIESIDSPSTPRKHAEKKWADRETDDRSYDIFDDNRDM